MTAPKSTLRRRRLIPGADLPADLVRWFSGVDRDAPWSALLPPESDLLAERWRAWCLDHPKAQPPAGLGDLIDIDQ